MRDSSPPFVTACRVGDLDIGDNPMRLLSFKCLPPNADVGDSSKHNVSDSEEGLSHVNLEVRFLYSKSPPGQPKRRNIRLLTHLKVGLGKKASVEVPVSVKITRTCASLPARASELSRSQTSAASSAFALRCRRIRHLLRTALP
jgi:hypothetical protein